jgi:hypothetical protein
MGYSDSYLRILRRSISGWQSNDWEKISAGWADRADVVDGYHIADGWMAY